MKAYQRPEATQEIVHVSASLREDGGGAARYGRLLGHALRRYCSRKGLRLRGLHLATSDGGPALDGYQSYQGNQIRLAAAVARLQLFGRWSQERRRGEESRRSHGSDLGRESQRVRGRRVLVFDHPGPARVQGRLPGWARARYAVALLGVDAWRPLDGDRGRALALASLLLPISETTADRAQPFLPSIRRLAVVHPGLAPEVAGGSPDSRALAAAGRDFVLVVGRMSAAERYKGHDELLEAWPELCQRIATARLVVVGDGDDRSRLEEKARTLSLGEAVTFLGFVDPATLAALYRRCALFTLPSRDEGFGFVFLEAMAAARPCLALAGTAPAEIIIDGETGRLVPAGDRGALVAALASLLTDPEQARRMGEAGRQRWQREFTFEAFEQRLEPHLDWLVMG